MLITNILYEISDDRHSAYSPPPHKRRRTQDSVYSIDRRSFNKRDKDFKDDFNRDKDRHRIDRYGKRYSRYSLAICLEQS